MRNNTFWQQLAIYEKGLVDLERSTDTSSLASASLAFFVHRSILTTTAELRAHELWRSGTRIQETTDRDVLLVKLYLEHFGALGTFTNLILEAEANCNPAHTIVVLDLSGASDTSTFDVAEGILRIAVSDGLLRFLGVDHELWKNIADALAATAVPVDPLVDQPMEINKALVQYRKMLQDFESEKPLEQLPILSRWSSESQLFKSLVEYFTGHSPDALPDDTVLGTIRLWMRAIRATFLFRQLGTTWYTAPTQSPFADLLNQDLGMRAPLSSWSAVTSGFDPTIERALAELAQTRMAQQRAATATPVQVLKAAIESRDLPRLEHMKQVAAYLIGSDHEGKPQSFTFLCCNDTEFLRWNVTGLETSHPKRWGLRIRQMLTSRDFGSNDEGKDALLQIVKAIQGNSLLLQQHGVFLWFSPVAGRDLSAQQFPHSLADYRPNAIVELVGDRMDRLDICHVLTERLKYAALIHVDEKQAALFQQGRCQHVCDGSLPDRRWNQHGQASLLEHLVNSVAGMDGMEVTSSEIQQRLKKVMAVAEEIARQRHGALIFLWNGRPENKTTPLSLAWGWASPNNYLELAEVATLAAAASLDGETIVDLSTGAYSVRQFTHPNHEFQSLSFFDDRTGAIVEDLLEKWRTPPEAKDEPVDLWSFGTRHQKALRVTWKQKNVLAITVSSSGPIRIWCDGKPIQKGKV